MTSNSLAENEEQDIPSHILKTIFGLHASVIFRPKYVWFSIHLKGPMIPDPSGQLAELIVYITSTRVDLYSHQILFNDGVQSPCYKKSTSVNSRTQPRKPDSFARLKQDRCVVFQWGNISVAFHVPSSEWQASWGPFWFNFNLNMDK